MKGPAALARHADRLRTSMGGCFLGSHAVFRGHDLHRELKDLDWLDLHVFGITGRRHTREQLRVLHAIWTHTSYPDARIWNNRIAALAGSARSTGALGMAAAVAVSEARIYGIGPSLSAYDFFAKAAPSLDRPAQLQALVREALREQRGIGGYGRPLSAQDERIAPLMSLAADAGLDQGPHVRLAFAVEEALLGGRWRLRMNYAALAAALVMDLGFGRRELSLFFAHAFLAGMAPCYLEAAERVEGSLFPLSCHHIDYQGQPPRAWPAQEESPT